MKVKLYTKWLLLSCCFFYASLCYYSCHLLCGLSCDFAFPYIVSFEYFHFWVCCFWLLLLMFRSFLYFLLLFFFSLLSLPLFQAFHWFLYISFLLVNPCVAGILSYILFSHNLLHVSNNIDRYLWLLINLDFEHSAQGRHWYNFSLQIFMKYPLVQVQDDCCKKIYMSHARFHRFIIVGSR